MGMDRRAEARDLLQQPEEEADSLELGRSSWVPMSSVHLADFHG